MRVLAIPAKKARQRPATYLEAEELRLIIGMPDRRTHDGWRDYTLLLFLYNCGARVSEAAELQWADLHLMAPRQVRLRGKGRKERLLPLWPETANALHRLRGMSHGADGQCVFVNRKGRPLTRDGIAYVLVKHATAAARSYPALRHKRITPHVLRHYLPFRIMSSSGTRALYLRQNGGSSSHIVLTHFHQPHAGGKASIVKCISGNRVVLSRAGRSLAAYIGRLQGHRVSSDINSARFSDRLIAFLNGL
jgi:integrase/recombinase XerD